MKWYVVKSVSNRERSVLERLKKESDSGNLANKIGRVLIPTEKTFFLRNGKRVFKEKIMYPGYIFVETDSLPELDYFVKGCDGATGILSDRNKQPQIIQEKEIEKMVNHQEVSHQQDFSGNYIVGEDVTILDGPFATFRGVVEDIIDQKVKVSVMIFGRKTIVELGALQVSKIDA